MDLRLKVVIGEIESCFTLFRFSGCSTIDAGPFGSGHPNPGTQACRLANLYLPCVVAEYVVVPRRSVRVMSA